MNIVRMTWVGAAGVSAIALILGGGCSSSSGGTQAGDSGTGSDVTMGDDSSSEDSGQQADTGTSSGGGDTGTSSGGGDTGTETDTGTVADTGSAGDSGTAADGSDGGCGGSTPVALTVLNFDAWCSVAIAGGTASTSSSQTVCVAAGPVTIVATPNGSSFAIGTDPWFGVDQNDGGAAPGTDNGSGSTETTTATVTVSSGSRCVSVCCGDAPNGTNCPTTNPCP